MILAAGFGTRLWPITSSVPKPLVPVANVPLIDRIIAYLTVSGVKSIVVNAHHRHEQLKDHLARADTRGIPVEVRVEREILGTGGGIKNTEDFWGDSPFIVVNGDILTDIDIPAAMERHRELGCLATLVLHDYGPFNKIILGNDLTVKDIPAVYTPGLRGLLAFTGIQILDPRLLEHIPGGRFSDIMDCHRALMAEGLCVGAYVSSGHSWREIGTVPAYLAANLEAAGSEGKLIGRNCAIAAGVEIKGRVVLGEGVVIEEGAFVSESVIWAGATLRGGVSVTGSVVTLGRTVSENLTGQVY